MMQVWAVLQIKRELVYILTSPLYKERYITTNLMNLPHLPTSAYRPQDTTLHIQEDCLLPKHLRHIQSMVLFSILFPQSIRKTYSSKVVTSIQLWGILYAA